MQSEAQQGPIIQRDNKHEDWIERLSTTLYIRFTRGPDYEDAFLCVDDGEPDMRDVARMSFGQARLFMEAYVASGRDLPQAEAVPQRETFCGNDNCHKDRRSTGKVTLADGRSFSCDPCIAPILRALNDAGLKTIASCCGHGFIPGNIVLKDGREIIIARNFAEARKIDKLSPIDINGNPVQRLERWARAARGDGKPQLADLSDRHRDVAELGARRAMSALRPGDELPGGLVVVPRESIARDALQGGGE